MIAMVNQELNNIDKDDDGFSKAMCSVAFLPTKFFNI